MNHIEKEKLIKADIASIENRVRHAFNQGYDLGYKEGKANCSEIPTGSTAKNDLGVDCIDRNKAYEIINSWADAFDVGTYFDNEQVKEIIMACANRIDDLPSVTPQEPRWIPVSERLPNWNTECLVIDGDGECGVGYYREDAHAWDSPNWGWLERKDRVDNKEAFTEPCGIGKVIAWMPLPRGYSEEEK